MRFEWVFEGIREGDFTGTARAIVSRGQARWKRSFLHPGVFCNYLQFSLDPRAKWCPENLDPERITDELKSSGVSVGNYTISNADFQQYLSQVFYPANYYAAGEGSRQPVFIEKALEHYVSIDLLKMAKGGTLLDIACSSSPFGEIVAHKYGLTVYKQDLVFPEGIQHPTTETKTGIIGGNAAKLPMPDNSVDGMVLHCAFEMFEGDNDSGLIREAGRVLRPGGKMIILPLYLHQDYFIRRDPLSNIWGCRIDDEARVEYRRDFYRVAFSRHYSIPAFVKRVVSNLGNLSLKVLVVENEKDIDPICYLKFIGVFEHN
jgi:ubiquinone/menaquinone biosynthesis C-methylase UbiE